MHKISKLAPIQNLAEILAEVHRDGFSHPWDKSSIETLLSQPGVRVWGAASADQKDLIGFVMVRSASVELEILTVAVRCAQRRKGVAEALLCAVFGDAAHTCETVFLEVDPQNTAARHLYEKLGFETIGERPRYYKYADGSIGDAIIMSLALGTA